MDDDFTTHQRFVRWAAFCGVTGGLASGGWCFWGVGCGCDIGICASGVTSQLKWRLWWMGVRSERAEIIPNVWCGASFASQHDIILSLFVAGAGFFFGF